MTRFQFPYMCWLEVASLDFESCLEWFYVLSGTQMSRHHVIDCCCFFPSILYAERQARLAEVERRWEEKKQSLTEELARVEKLLAGAYDR